MGEYYNFPTQPFLQKIVGLPRTENSICLQKPDLGAIQEIQGLLPKEAEGVIFQGCFKFKGSEYRRKLTSEHVGTVMRMRYRNLLVAVGTFGFSLQHILEKTVSLLLA